MRRSEIIQGLKQFHDALVETRLTDAFSTMRRAGPELPPPVQAEALTALRNYGLLAQNFNAPAKLAVRAFGLEGLEDPTTWVSLLASRERDTREELVILYRGMVFATDFLPRVTELLVHGSPSVVAETLAVSQNERTTDILSVLLVEREGSLSRPARIRDLIDAVEALYHVSATLQGTESGTLVFAACDSGSEPSFDFLGLARVVQGVRQTISDIWDRVVFHREAKLEARAAAIEQTLPVLVEINSRVNDGTIAPEQGELLRRALTDGVTKFLRCGAVTPDLQTRAYNDPRQLMLPERRLLTPPPESATPSANAAPTPPSTLSPEELATLKTLMRKLSDSEAKQ